MEDHKSHRRFDQLLIHNVLRVDTGEPAESFPRMDDAIASGEGASPHLKNPFLTRKKSLRDAVYLSDNQSHDTARQPNLTREPNHEDLTTPEKRKLKSVHGASRRFESDEISPIDFGWGGRRAS